MRLRWIEIASLIALSFATRAAGAGCLQFWPVEVQLSGLLDARVYAGPPNYESIADGDRAERAFILVLADSICVDPDPESEVNIEPQREIREVHMRWSNGDLGALVGKDVLVRGRLSTTTIGHDRTPVVMDVTEVQVD